MTTPTPQPGWHPDPEGKPQLRWWDGQQWTAATQPLPAHPGTVTPPPSGFDPRTNESSNPTFSARSYPDLARDASSTSVRNGFGVTALVLAIVGVVFGLVPLTGFIALILGLLSVLFGLLGFGRVRKRLATNKIMTLAGTGLGVVAVALGIWGMTIFFGAVDELDQKLDNLGDSASTVTGEAPAPDAEAAPGSRENPLHPGQALTLRDGTSRSIPPPGTRRTRSSQRTSSTTPRSPAVSSSWRMCRPPTPVPRPALRGLI